MAYTISCRKCGKDTKAGNIVWLFSEHHSDPSGNIKCKNCESTEAHIFRNSQLQEEGSCWKRYIEMAIKLSSNEKETYQPYAFLTTGEPGGEIGGIHFGYYKDLRGSGGRLKHGHGPGGAPVIGKDSFLRLARELGRIGVIKPEELEELASEMRK